MLTSKSRTGVSVGDSVMALPLVQRLFWWSDPIWKSDRSHHAECVNDEDRVDDAADGSDVAESADSPTAGGSFTRSA
jgi:hypothetical protein